MCAALALFWMGIVMMLGVTAVVPGSGPMIDQAPTPGPSLAACPVTLPNTMTPPSEEPSPGHHGDGLLYTVLGAAGELIVDDTDIGADGWIAWKLPVWRAPGVGDAGDLEIAGHELSTGAYIRSHVPEGYGQRFQATGIYFPSEGCYEITLRSGDTTLTFVTRLTRMETVPWRSPSPAPTSPV